MLRLMEWLYTWISLPRRQSVAGGGACPPSKNWAACIRLLAPFFLAEMRAVSRNKPIAVALAGNMFLVPIFLCLLYFRDAPENLPMLLFGTALLSSIPAINYASFCIGKDGAYLPGYLTRMSVHSYVHWKVLVLRAYTLVFALAIGPLSVRAGPIAAMAFCASTVYSAGVGGLMVLCIASFSRSKIDLGGPLLGGAHHMPLYTVFFVMPVTTPLFFCEGAAVPAVWATFLLGVAGFALSTPLTGLIENNVHRRKHILLNL